MSDNPMPFAEAAAEEKKRTSGSNPPPHRPFDQMDIRLAGDALAKELALGGKVDIYMVARKMLDASGVISSRATPRPPNQASIVAVANRAAKKEQDNAQPSEAQ
jgi:hypothetical protein